MPVRKSPEEDRFGPGLVGAARPASSSGLAREPSIWPSSSSAAKGICRMKEGGSSACNLNSRSIFARRSRKICSSSASERSSLSMPAGLGAASRGTSSRGAHCRPGVLLRSETRSWLASSSSTATCDTALLQLLARTCGDERTLRIFPRSSLSRGSLAFARPCEHPEPRRYHGLLARDRISMPGKSWSSAGSPRVHGLSFRLSLRNDRKHCRTGRFLQLAISFDDRSSSSSDWK
mmetsp:Transcript_91163/g.283401  ORF Transcript_91163/g.283401 Transcript_91163/m.283401 type:complete len:234 (-) Transcript_91163:755-1456(-)